jgi:CRISPR-associated protein Csb1
MSITYSELREGVAGKIAGIRAHNVLEPLGGPRDKVFPPTYGVPDSAPTRYAIEKRITAGETGGAVESVVLDSVASQANRFELALLGAIRRGEAQIPVTSADFRSVHGLEGMDRISDYDAPHRIFDALLRDSYDGDYLFRHGPTGSAITEARPGNAAAIYHHSPHTLVFGGWDSTGPRGGLGSKYERAVTSEIVALDIELGKKTSSRIDPAGIQMRAGKLLQAVDGTWTLNEAEAARDKGNPRLYGKAGEAGRPSQANHGNIAPSIDAKAGGVTAGKIVATTVLSLIQLRRLRFPTLPDGTAVEGTRRDEAEVAARTALAALGLAAAVLAFEEGFDLRSRCVLVASEPSTFEAVGRSGDVSRFDLSGADALKLVAEATDAAAQAGIAWRPGELLLRPSDRLAELIRRSQALVASGQVEEGGK